MMELGDFGGPMCETRFALYGPRNSLGGLTIVTSRQGRLFPPCGGNSCGGQAACMAGACADHEHSGHSTHIPCKMTASFRATATRALLRLPRFAMRMPQALSVDHLETRVSSTLAAS